MHTTTYHKPRRRTLADDPSGARCFRPDKADHGAAQAAAVEMTREEFKNLLDFYEPFTLSDEPVEQRKELEPTSEDPKIAEDTADETHFALPAEDEPQQRLIDELEELLNDEEGSHEEIYDLYSRISFPRVSYLSLGTIYRLLKQLSYIEHKNEAAMIRYLSIIDDMKAAEIPIRQQEWNTAMHLAGRCFKDVSFAQVEKALHLWKEMETESGTQANHVTFNILFDIATKAGKFQLADKIMEEMEKRNLRLSRYFRTGLIYYYGRKGSGDGVRKAYKELVEAGEIVDTAVMNCVIASLIRAGEATAAEQVYERMKRMHLSRAGGGAPPRDWKGARELGKLLERAARMLREDPAARRKVQDASPVAPDLHTFRLLVRYHAVSSGNIDRITELLGEMQHLEVPLHGSIFVHLFRGFHTHGGIRYTSWTKSRLESTWKAWLQAHERDEHGSEGFRVDRPLALAITHAYGKCVGRDRMLEIWDEVRSRWKPDDQELESVSRLMRRLFPYEPSE